MMVWLSSWMNIKGARGRNTRSWLSQWRCLGFARTGVEMFVFCLLYQIRNQEASYLDEKNIKIA